MAKVNKNFNKKTKGSSITKVGKKNLIRNRNLAIELKKLINQQALNHHKVRCIELMFLKV